MKKNTMMKIASVLLIAVLLTTCVISGTFAKYTSDFNSVADTARVAKWAFQIDDTAVDSGVRTFTFDLFNTVNEVATTENDAQIKDGVGEVIIAPGSTGSASVKLTNISEVDATYAVAFTANENGVPLQWSTNGIDWKNDIAELNIPTTAIAMTNGEATITMYWKWQFETGVEGQTDVTDTALGTAVELATVSFAATITVTQAD